MVKVTTAVANTLTILGHFFSSGFMRHADRESFIKSRFSLARSFRQLKSPTSVTICGMESNNRLKIIALTGTGPRTGFRSNFYRSVGQERGGREEQTCAQLIFCFKTSISSLIS
jgi:hypothetical protein